jgi:TonB family protein
MTSLVAVVLLAAATPAPEPISPPRLLAEPPRPGYPAGQTDAARVVLQLTVDATGEVREVEVVSPEHPPFDAVATAEARALRFAPATRDGKPIAVRIQYAFQFEPPAAAPAGELSGTVRERGTRRKLSGIEVTIGDRAAVTDAQGRFELGEVTAGAQRVVIAAPGYRRLELTEAIADGQRLEVAYLLDPVDASPYEATVTGERTRREVSKTSISTAETERVPGTRGDALKIVEDLPGVARTSPIGGGQLVIRGSKPGDSLVYLDGERIPLLYHFFALSSTVNSDLLAGIDFVPGNFGASYGDLTGGLVEVRTRPSRDELHGYANLNALEGSVLFEGPIGPGLTFAAAGRRSYMDAVMGAVVDSSQFRFTAAPRYHDAQVRLDWAPPGSAHRLSVLALTSNDTLGMLFRRPISDDPNQVGGLDLSTGFSQLRFSHRWQAGALGVETIAMVETQEHRNTIGSEAVDVTGRSFMLRSTATLELSEHVALAGGVDSVASQYTVSGRLPKSMLRLEGEPSMGRPDEEPTEISGMRYDRYTPALWTEARFTPLPGLTVTPGVRLDVFTYVTDRERTSTTLSPRLGVRWDATPQLALKGGAGLYSQGARDAAPLPVVGNPDVQPERAFQLTAGAELRPANGYLVTVEGFWKKLDRLVVHTSAADAQGLALNVDNAGTGRVYGLEVLVRKELGDRAFGWIAYTLSRSARVDRPGEATRLFDFDQTHNLTAVGGYRLGRGWQLGARLRLISGNPTTPVIGAAYLASIDSYLPMYGATNSDRAPLFAQLDLRIDKVWTYDRWTLNAYLDVLNATNHRSVEGVAFNYDFTRQARIEGLPLFPSVGLKASF